MTSEILARCNSADVTVLNPARLLSLQTNQKTSPIPLKKETILNPQWHKVVRRDSESGPIIICFIRKFFYIKSLTRICFFSDTRSFNRRDSESGPIIPRQEWLVDLVKLQLLGETGCQGKKLPKSEKWKDWLPGKLPKSEKWSESEFTDNLGELTHS